MENAKKRKQGEKVEKKENTKLRNIKFFLCLIVHGKVEGKKISVLLTNLFSLV